MKILRMAALAAAFALTACSQQSSSAPAAMAASPGATAAAPAAKSWEGTYEINFANDDGGTPGGADVIWNGNSGTTNEFELVRSKTTLGGLETYDCASASKATPAWQNCLFIRVGDQQMVRPDIAGHKLPVKPWDKSKFESSKAEVEPIAFNALHDKVKPDTERLVGSFVKGDHVEYLVLYRIVDGISDGKVNSDLLLIRLKDPRVVAGVFEDGWGTGGKKGK